MSKNFDSPIEKGFCGSTPVSGAPFTDAKKQMEHDAGLIGVLMEDKNRLRTERDNWRRKYFEMERAQSRSIDQNGEHIKRIQRLEREKDEIRNDLKATPVSGAQEFEAKEGETCSDCGTFIPRPPRPPIPNHPCVGRMRRLMAERAAVPAAKQVGGEDAKK